MGQIGLCCIRKVQHSHTSLHGYDVKRSLVCEGDLWVEDGAVLLETGR
jgi:hypothetical protein